MLITRFFLILTNQLDFLKKTFLFFQKIMKQDFMMLMKQIIFLVTAIKSLMDTYIILKKNLLINFHPKF